jgi:hypothetical protein
MGVTALAQLCAWSAVKVQHSLVLPVCAALFTYHVALVLIAGEQIFD